MSQCSLLPNVWTCPECGNAVRCDIYVSREAYLAAKLRHRQAHRDEDYRALQDAAARVLTMTEGPAPRVTFYGAADAYREKLAELRRALDKATAAESEATR